ncbi:protein kinase domain-containing protein [Saltatorellus ferox]
MSQNDPSAAPVDDLLFRYLEESGEKPADAVLEELCAESPSLAGELRALVGILNDTGLAEPGAGQETLGPYRLLRRLGAGGMGVVYLAAHADDGRHVALKIVRPEQLFFEPARERFRREIDAVARLSHAGIAAIHDGGESRGVPYFAQEYVEGASLEIILQSLLDREASRLTGADMALALERALWKTQTVASGPGTFFAGGWAEVCARIGLAAADALEHAHSRGILHRDIKPSNLLLTPGGRVVLVDFGLAALADGARLTRTGSILGSMPYLAPELIDGGKATVASDVYSLGVTLYELAALSLPFVAQHPDELRRQILLGDPVRPRRRNAEIPRDLETIIGGALEGRPGHRYPSAAAFSSDLQAFLSARRISMKPPGLWRRSVKVARKHPTASSIGVALATLLTAGPLAYGLIQARNVRAVESLNRQLSEAVVGQGQALESADRHFTLAIDAVHHLLEQFSDSALDEFPALAPLRLAAIERALETFKTLGVERGEDAGLIRETALATRARGDALYDLSRLEESLAAQRHHVELLERLMEKGPLEWKENADLWFEMGVGHARVGRTLAQLRRPLDATVEHRRAMDATCNAIALAPANPDPRLALVSHQTNLAMSQSDAALFDEARATGDECIQAAKALRCEFPGDARAFEVLARALRQRYSPPLVEASSESRLPALERARTALRAALAMAPRDREVQNDLNRVDFMAAQVHVANGRLLEARSILEACRVEAEALAHQFPAFDHYTGDVLDICGLLAHVARLQGEWELARSAMREVADASDDLALRSPDNLPSASDARSAHVNLANVYINSPDLGQERFELALGSLDRASEWHELLLSRVADEVDGPQAAFQITYNKVVVEGQLGRWAEAESLARTLSTMSTRDPFDQRLIADAWCEVRIAMERAATDFDADGSLVQRRDQAQENALLWIESAVAAGYSDRDELGSTPALDFLRDHARFIALLASIPVEAR